MVTKVLSQQTFEFPSDGHPDFTGSLENKMPTFADFSTIWFHLPLLLFWMEKGVFQGAKKSAQKTTRQSTFNAKVPIFECFHNLIVIFTIISGQLCISLVGQGSPGGK